VLCWLSHQGSTLRQQLTPEFLYYSHEVARIRAWKDFIFTQATIQNIGADKLRLLADLASALAEQQRIAAYLDASCAAIDAALSAKRRQLETSTRFVVQSFSTH